MAQPAKALRTVGGVTLVQRALDLLVGRGDEIVVAAPADAVDTIRLELADQRHGVAVTVVAGGRHPAGVRGQRAASGQRRPSPQSSCTTRRGPWCPPRWYDGCSRHSTPAPAASYPSSLPPTRCAASQPTAPTRPSTEPRPAGADPSGLRGRGTAPRRTRDAKGDDATDDATLVEATGEPVTLVDGDPLGFKITRPLDLVLAEALLDRELSRFRTTRAVAMAASPSPRPVSPRPSVVVAVTVTGAAAGRAQSGLRLGSARAEPGDLPDQLDGDVADCARPPSGVGRSRASRATPLAPAQAGSDVPNWLPRSPSPAADSSASQQAWATTSPSE